MIEDQREAGVSEDDITAALESLQKSFDECAVVGTAFKG